jgi:hypothetical protein
MKAGRKGHCLFDSLKDPFSTMRAGLCLLGCKGAAALHKFWKIFQKIFVFAVRKRLQSQKKFIKKITNFAISIANLFLCVIITG